MRHYQIAFVLGIVSATAVAACGDDPKAPSRAGSGGTAGGGAGGKAQNGGSSGKASSGGKSGSGGKGGNAGSSSGGTSGRGGKGGSAGGDPGTGGMGESGSGGTGGSSGMAGEAGQAGEAGAGGESAESPLVGARVRFIGAEHTFGGETEAELRTLIVLETGFASTRIHAAAGGPALIADDLAGADIVVIDSVQRNYTAEEATIVADWVEDGHGLVILNGYSASPVLAEPFAAPFSITFGSGLVSGSEAGNLIGGADILDHPIMTDVANIMFYGGYQLTSGDGMATPFATVSNQPAGLARSWGQGRVAVWGDDWVVLTSQLDRVDSATTSYPTRIFWRNLLGWVARPRKP
jgi:hypothetical protein